MKTIIINSLLGFLGIFVGALTVTLLGAFFADTFNDVLILFIRSIVAFSLIGEATIIIALLIKLIIKPFKRNIIKREYTFNVWMKHYSNTRQKLLTTITVEASSLLEAKNKAKNRYPGYLYSLERI
jgi:hypothetical protein